MLRAPPIDCILSEKPTTIGPVVSMHVRSLCVSFSSASLFWGAYTYTYLRGSVVYIERDRSETVRFAFGIFNARRTVTISNNRRAGIPHATFRRVSSLSESGQLFPKRYRVASEKKLLRKILYDELDTCCYSLEIKREKKNCNISIFTILFSTTT